MSVTIDLISPLIGGIVRVDKRRLCDDDVVEAVRTAVRCSGGYSNGPRSLPSSIATAGKSATSSSGTTKA